jgi:hypothetical protein
MTPAALAGVVLSVGWGQIANLLGFQINSEGIVRYRFRRHDDAPCAAIPGGHGFSIISGRNILPMHVTNVSTFWFGLFSNRTDRVWTQVTAPP